MTDSTPVGSPAAKDRAPADVFRVVLAYAVFASLWILLSDTVVGWLVSDPARIILVSTLKGWLFVAVTSLLLYGLMRRVLDQALAASRQKLEAQTEKARALQLLDAIVASSTDAIFAKDVDDRFTVFSQGAARITGKRAEDVLGRDEMAVFPPEIAKPLIADNRRVMAENRIIAFEDDIVTLEGRRTYLSTKGPLHDTAGKVIGMFGIARDITEHHRATAALHEQAETLLQRNAELDRFNRVAVDRELDMIRLKQQVNTLSLQLGRAAPYALEFAAPAAASAAEDSSTPAAEAPG